MRRCSDSPGSPLAHFTTLTSCLSPSSLRLVRSAAAESGWAWSCPAFTTSGSMDSRTLRKTSCEWNVRLVLGDGFRISSAVPEPDGMHETRLSSSGTFCWPIFFSLRAKRERVTRLKCWTFLEGPGPSFATGHFWCLDPYQIRITTQLVLCRTWDINRGIIHGSKEQLLKNLHTVGRCKVTRCYLNLCMNYTKGRRHKQHEDER